MRANALGLITMRREVAARYARMTRLWLAARTAYRRLHAAPVQQLHALLDSAPDVLFASAPALQAGKYTLHWHVRSMSDQDDSDGMIPFSVAR